ncbi:bifunctional cobalt-precorrin-7 (C(5))-methyltransferase/cobalt-precorrin-6B (C(15))-methyltransferase [Acuticoccus mangrovi]|uniref:Cobalamin biosynthesis bifunctional protein CbiET n=1 Tax=Acuticoccus mangrovi TaxID=2796142 RepID=A0A934ISP4_9HYPH|nr:bifunctional cobalt-precorrin-7 (C(5))-methyltransferase CbiE/decarboxylating cobalt-precorrin-6B (C(15))-methyltransferase CbiT [Acuticoccus mangrovi]MBJ3777315.1 cobalamin biosynthesis bifunctional protein CbiET [Acuticoccus mangrovi]
MAPWLTVIGCLPDGTLAPRAPRGALEGAVFGAPRLLEAVGVPAAARHPWPRPFSEGIAAILARRGTPTTVLASGDPLHYGVATTLLAHVPIEEMSVYPAPSAFALAAARHGWAQESVTTLSLHAAPETDILTHAAPGRRLLALTRDGGAPARIAAILTGAGYGDSPVHILQNLGSPEAAVEATIARSVAGEFAALNVVSVECRRPGPVGVDDLVHDGCVTRDEIRALTLAALGAPGHLWDVGAGSGAVAIDWCRTGGTATLFERVPSRIAAIRENLAATCTRATLLAGEAADRLAEAAPPDAVFLGGGVADDVLFAALWQRLPPGGVIVSNAVTLSGEAATLARYALHGGRLTRIALSHAEPVGRLVAMKPAMPVLQWRGVKP